MARISDIIESFLKELIEESDESVIKIQRNELARHFGCAPSQINYVLMTRFDYSQGYHVESFRGGGGYIRIEEILIDEKQKLFHIMTRKIGDCITKPEANRLIQSLLKREIISLRESKIMKSAIDDTAIVSPLKLKGEIRANILKNMLASIFY